MAHDDAERRWFPPPPHLEESFLEAVQEYAGFEAALRKDSNLRRLSGSLYPEVAVGSRLAAVLVFGRCPHSFHRTA